MTERDCISVLREHGFKENIQGALYRFINESDYMRVRPTNIQHSIEMKLRVGGRAANDPMWTSDTIRLCEFEDGGDLINWLSAQYGKAYIKVFKDEVEGK